MLGHRMTVFVFDFKPWQETILAGIRVVGHPDLLPPGHAGSAQGRFGKSNHCRCRSCRFFEAIEMPCRSPLTCPLYEMAGLKAYISPISKVIL